MLKSFFQKILQVLNFFVPLQSNITKQCIFMKQTEKNYSKLNKLNLQIKRQLDKEKTPLTASINDGQTLVVHPLWKFHFDVTETLAKLDYQELAMQHKRELIHLQHLLKRQNEETLDTTGISPDFIAFCEKYGIPLGKKQNQRKSYDKT